MVLYQQQEGCHPTLWCPGIKTTQIQLLEEHFYLLFYNHLWAAYLDSWYTCSGLQDHVAEVYAQYMHHHMQIASHDHCCGPSVGDFGQEHFDLLTLLGFHNLVPVCRVLGLVSDFLSMSDVFALQPARRYVTQVLTQGVVNTLSSLFFITLMTLPIIRVPMITGTLEVNSDKSRMTRTIWSSL